MLEQILFIAELLLTGLVTLLLLAVAVSIITVIYSYIIGGKLAMYMVLSIIAIVAQVPIFVEGKQKALFVILAIGCLITSIGIGISPTEPGIVYGIGAALMALGVIAIRVLENREFRDLKHDLDIYQQTKIVNGITTLELGSISLLVAVSVTGMAINYYTVPSLIVVVVGAVKLLKHIFIDISSPELLSWVIKVKYFFMDTSKLIAKAMEYKINQTNQRVAA